MSDDVEAKFAMMTKAIDRLIAAAHITDRDHRAAEVMRITDEFAADRHRDGYLRPCKSIAMGRLRLAFAHPLQIDALDACWHTSRPCWTACDPLLPRGTPKSTLQALRCRQDKSMPSNSMLIGRQAKIRVRPRPEKRPLLRAGGDAVHPPIDLEIGPDRSCLAASQDCKLGEPRSPRSSRK